MTHKELEDEIKNYLKKIKNYVIDNKDSYPACISPDQIVCYIKSSVENLYGLETVTGYCFKDSDKLGDYKKTFEGLKLRDFVVFYENILKSITIIKDLDQKGAQEKESNIGVTDAEFKDAVLSIVTHEFMHAISVGFADDDTKNDEVYTNLYAEELFKIVLPEGKFYDMYMMCPDDSKYIEEMKAAKEEREEKNNIRNLYFQGAGK